jgi:putative ubiquitin-RnfH superfamily antitoxin RatB of RatAB toxin-antitoxin module
MRAYVVYATPAAQPVIEVDVPAGATVRDAISASGILTRFPDIDLARAAVGVFGERATLDDPLEENDRVEIYRPLLADPKESRRRRARKKR